MIVKPLWEGGLKEENQTLTQASSELAAEVEGEWRRQEGEQEGMRRGETRLKYRKLKQKLNSMGFHHDDKCVVSKDFTSPKKQRIMKLALDFERMIKIQNRDYFSIELTAKEIQKIVDGRNELDLQLLRQSRFIPAFFQLLQKVPSLHKAEFNQLLRGLETCFRILYSFAAIGVNREYLILTNRLNSFVSFISWILGREEKKSSLNPAYYNVQTTCFKLLNLLLLHKSKEEDILSISATTVQLIICSQLFKKIKVALLEQFYLEDTLQQTELILQILRFMLHVIRKSQPKLTPVYSILANDPCEESSKQNPITSGQQPKYLSASLAKLIEFIMPFLISYFNLLQQTESISEGEQFPQSYPTFLETLMSMVVKVLNACFQASFITFKKVILQIGKETGILPTFLEKVKIVTKYCMFEFEQYSDNTITKGLLNEIIILLGYLALDDLNSQKKINQCGILEQLFNLPIQYLMDQHLRDISIPTFCSLIHQNKPNLILMVKDNCPQPIIKALRKQIQSQPSLNRKNSTCSLISRAVISYDYNAPNYETQRLSLQMRFPQIYWETLCAELEKHV